MSLAVIHDRLAVSAVLFAGVCAVWGFINYIRKQPMTSGYWGALVICEVLMIVQAVFGIVLAIQGNHPPRAIVHYLYGISAVISLPAVYVFTGGRTPGERACSTRSSASGSSAWRFAASPPARNRRRWRCCCVRIAVR